MKMQNTIKQIRYLGQNNGKVERVDMKLAGSMVEWLMKVTEC